MESCQNYIEKPIKLLSFDSAGHAIIHEQAISLLQLFPKPISVLSIAGPFRTGKSYLLNCLISGQNNFQVGSTTQSCTKGLWIWGKPLLSVDEFGKITNILMIDTQGFGSCDEIYDKRIIILALMLSTCFIYNSKGLIDKESLNDLSYVIKQTNKIKKQISLDSVTDFFWVLRDFHFQLVNELGFHISPDQYMEKCLKQISQKSQQHKQIHKELCNFFRNRSCHTFISPETNEKNEKNPQFIQQILKFKKTLNRIPSMDVDGIILSEIIKSYTEGMNQNLTEDELWRQGIECRIRINCVNNLWKQMLEISEQKNEEKRQKMLKLALDQVKQNCIRKMMSQKQVNILKQQIDGLISQFDVQSLQNQSQNGKIKTITPQKRKLMGYKSIFNQKDSDIKDSHNRNAQSQIQKEEVKQMSNVMQRTRLRQQLEGKIYRYQLQIQQLLKQAEEYKIKNRELQQKRQQLQLQMNQYKFKILQNEHAYRRHIIQVEEQRESEKEQKQLQYLQLQKKLLLYEDKISFLQSKIGEIELNAIQEKGMSCLKYKCIISDLQKQNRQIAEQYQKYIEEVKQIYAPSPTRKSNFPQNKSQNFYKLQQNEQAKGYRSKIHALEQQLQEQLIRRLQYENKIQQLQIKSHKLIGQHRQQMQNLQKKYREKQQNLQELYQSQIANKEQLYQQLQSRSHQQRQSLHNQIQILSNRCLLQNQSAHYTVQSYERQLNNLQTQVVCLCEKLQAQETLRCDKERQNKILQDQIQILRTNSSKDYNTYFQNMRQLKEDNLKLNKLKEELKQEKCKLTQQRDQSRQEMKKQQQQHYNMKKQYKSFHQLEILRLENKINNLQQTNSELFHLHNQYEQLKQQYVSMLQQKQLIQQACQNKDNSNKILQLTCINLRNNNERLQSMVKQLRRQLDRVKADREQETKRDNQKISQKQKDYISLLSEMHTKQKQLYMLSQKYQNSANSHTIRYKQLNKHYSQKIQQKNKQIEVLNSNIARLKLNLLQNQTKINQTSQELSLLTQRYGFIQQGYKQQIKNLTHRYTKQDHKNKQKICKFEQVINALSSQKKQMEKKIQILRHNERQTCKTLAQMRDKNDRYMEQYETKIGQMRQKIIHLEAKNKGSCGRISRLQSELKNIHTNKEILQNNYNEDFKLWSSKLSAALDNSGDTPINYRQNDINC